MHGGVYAPPSVAACVRLHSGSGDAYGVATTLTQTTSGPVLTMPVATCSLIPPPPMPSGNQWFTMTVTLRIHDVLGNVSADSVHKDVRLFPVGACGF